MANSVATVIFTLLIQMLGASNSLNQPFLEVFFNHAVWVVIIPFGFLWFGLFERKRSHLKELPWKRLLIWSVTGGPLLIFGAFSYYLSLTRTSIVVSNAVQNSVFILIFALSVVFLGEVLTVMRVLSSVVCVGGVVLLAFGSAGLSSDGDPEFSLWGGFFLAISLILGSAYAVVFSWLFRVENIKYGNSPIISLWAISFIGASTLLLMWAGLLIGHYSGLEPFVLPSLPQFKMLLLNALMDLILNLANLLAILFIGASLNAVGLLLAVPLSVLTQAIYLGAPLNTEAYFGIALISLGCVSFYVGDLVVVKMLSKCRKNDLALEEEEEEQKLIQ